MANLAMFVLAPIGGDNSVFDYMTLPEIDFCPHCGLAREAETVRRRLLWTSLELSVVLSCGQCYSRLATVHTYADAE